MWPLSSTIEFSLAAELAIALALGIGFGVALERAGFGSARKLTAVFYLHDMAVTKVMFTAVVTTMAGLFVLSALDLLDLGELYVEPTNLLAQGIGGLLFGAGFLIGGYCPGTSVAAIASGRKDAVLFALGMLAGVYAYAAFTPQLDDWYKANSLGELTLPALTGVGMGWWTLAFIVALFISASGMSRIEGRARREPGRRAGA